MGTKNFGIRTKLTTRAFVSAFGDAVASQSAASPKTALSLHDQFIKQTEKNYSSSSERAEKYRRVCAKILAQFPEITLEQIHRHAPSLAPYTQSKTLFFARPEHLEAAHLEAAKLLATAKNRAGTLLAAAEEQAATLVSTATKQALATEQTTHEKASQASQAKASSEAALREASAARENAKQSATGIMANAQRESTKLLRTAGTKAEAIEAESRALEAKIEGLKIEIADLAAPLRAHLEHAFTAGGCTFHVSSEALEAHPDCYLSVLARSPMLTLKNDKGAYEVHDITAKELKALCHFLNEGTLIGPLAKRDAAAQELMSRFGSDTMAQAVALPHEEACSLKLDAADIKRHCAYDSEVEKRAARWASHLVRELPHAKWADGTCIQLDKTEWAQKQVGQADLFAARAGERLIGGDGDWSEPFSTWQAAARAVQRWFEAAELAPPAFALQDSRWGTRIFFTFKEHVTQSEEG